MSTLSSWTYVATLTLWRLSGEDEFSQRSYAAPVTMLGDWAKGGDTEVAEGGEEFTSDSEFYFEFDKDSADLLKRGDFIAIGDLTGTSSPIVAGASMIKKVNGWEMEKFGEGEIPDWVAIT